MTVLATLKANTEHLQLLYTQLRQAKRLDHLRAAGKWTARQIIVHLADIESRHKVHTMMMLTQDNPTFTSFDPDAWANIGRYSERNPLRSLQIFVQLREHNCELWDKLTPEQLARPGTSPRMGAVTVESWLRFITEHDQRHFDQIAACIFG
jgi:hypothetical protein